MFKGRRRLLHVALAMFVSVAGAAINLSPVRASGDAYSAAVMGDSPSAYWRLDQAGTTTAFDQLGQSDGTVNGGVTLNVTGALTSSTDSAMSFNGSTGYVTLPVSSGVKPTGAMSVEAWVKTSSASLMEVARVDCNSSPLCGYSLVLTSSGDVEFGNEDGSGGHYVTGSTAVDDNHWHYIVGTKTSTQIKVYVDGTLDGTLSDTSAMSYSGASGAALGRNGDTSSFYYNGAMDDVAIYPSALTSTQISNHYTESGATAAAPTGDAYLASVNADNPNSLWRLDETSGTVANDKYSKAYGAISASGVTLNQTGPLLTSSNKAMAFDGSSGYINLPASTWEQPTSAITVEAWEKSSSATSTADVALKFRCDVSPECGYSIGINSSTYGSSAYFYIRTSGGTLYIVQGATSLADGVWHHLVGTKDASGLRLYVDGVQVDSTAETADIYYGAYTGMAIGRDADDPNYYFKGSLADMAVYPSALPVSRILAHFMASGRDRALTGGALTNVSAPTPNNFCLACAVAHAIQGVATFFPINTESGNFYHEFVDMSIPGRTYPLAIVRTYNSQNAATDGPFGYGWSYNYGMSLSCSGTTVTITQEDSSQVTFTTTGSCSSGTWTPSAPRYIATLSWNSGTSTWTFKRQGKDTYTFNSSGQLTTETDLNGYVTSFTYTSGNLTTITDPAGRTLTLTWTGSHITTLTDANVTPNRTVSYSYTSDQLTDVTDVAGGDTSFAYDGSHRVTTMKDPVCDALGGSCPGVQNHYDGSSRVDWQKDALNRETTFSYSGDPQSADGGTTTITDPASNVVVDGYAYGVRTFTTHGSGTASAATNYFQYDPDTLALTSIIDPNGNMTTYTVDSSGNVLTATDPLGRVTTNTYNSFNEVLTTEDGKGVTTTMTYDGNGNLATTSTPVSGGSCTCQVATYNHANGTYPGDVTSIVDPNSKTTYLHYDSNGYQDQVKDPLGNVTGTVHNADGFVTSSYTPKASCTWNSSPPTGCSATYKTTYTVNAFGDPLTITDPLSHVTTMGYDANRNETSVEDGNTNTTTNTFDVANELTTVTRPDTTTQVTEYNDDGTVKDQKDGKGNKIVSYGYDSLARVISFKDALNNETDYTYDLDGNVLTKQDPSGNCATPSKCTTNTYDADNELKTVTYSDGVTPNITSVTYDSDGQRTGMSDGTGSPTWTFDQLHRLTGYTSGNGDAITYGYGSDLKNQVATIAYPNSVGTVTQTWNDDGTLASVEDWNSKTTTFAYDANANQTGQTVPSTTNATDTFGFNAGDQMTSVSDSNGSALFSATYTRDSNGQLASDNSQAANQQNYKYTSLNQLCYAASATANACSSAPANSYPYGFDSADNLTTMENAAHSATNAQQFNNADQLCWVLPSGSSANACASVPTGATTFNYDDRGNRTSQVPSAGSATCTTYDQADRLTSVKTGTGSSCTSPTTLGTYSYDGSGLRSSKTVSGTTTHYTWGGSLLLQEKAGSTTTSYIYGPGGLPIEQIVGSTTTYLHHDQIGSTRLITDSAGATGTATTLTYDPYGNSVSTSGSLTTNLQFQGQYLDSESGLYYLRARYYDPTTAQFLTQDPMVAKTLSPYAYVDGNPLNARDPSGLVECGVVVDPKKGCDDPSWLSDIALFFEGVGTGVGGAAGGILNGCGQALGDAAVGLGGLLMGTSDYQSHAGLPTPVRIAHAAATTGGAIAGAGLGAVATTSGCAVTGIGDFFLPFCAAAGAAGGGFIGGWAGSSLADGGIEIGNWINSLGGANSAPSGSPVSGDPGSGRINA